MRSEILGLRSQPADNPSNPDQLKSLEPGLHRIAFRLAVAAIILEKADDSDFYNLFTTFGYMQRQLQRAIGGAAMATDDRRSGLDRRTDQDRRRSVDTRSDEQKRLQGERRANSGRRSSFNRRVVKNRSADLETEG